MKHGIRWGRAGIMVAMVGATTQSHAFNIGDAAICSGETGTIIRIDPRPGWDEPFYVVEVRGSTVSYEFKCVPSQLVAVPSSNPAPNAARTGTMKASSTSNLKMGAPQKPAAGGSLCKLGAKIEAQWGISWYAVTVRAEPNANGQCAISFDGYGREWDTLKDPDQLRPKGGPGGVYARSPGAHTVDDEESAPARTEAPDGDYRCHKISPGGQLMDIGDLEIDDGEATLAGMPEGWTVVSVSVRGTKNGEPIVALDYRSTSGFNDRLDCVPQ